MAPAANEPTQLRDYLFVVLKRKVADPESVRGRDFPGSGSDVPPAIDLPG